ncbi:MAG TPA: hypothetical protein VJ370_07555 [Streptosporangiaceae bacterium]|nr:hypothetical protein [Streptosporangiaceae bacterium]
MWWLLLGASVAAAAGILAMPEPGTRRPGVLASLRPRVGVPREARGTFATAVPCLFAVWALSGLYQSLGPSLTAQVTGSRDLLWGGLLIFLLTGVAAAATAAFRGVAPRTAMLAGCLVLLAGLAVTFAAIAITTAAAFLAGTGVAGVGVGLTLLGVNRALIPLAPPGRRAGLIAAIFIISFLGLSIPALIAGVATAHFGLHRTALAYCVAVAALVAAAAGSLILTRRGAGSHPGSHPAGSHSGGVAAQAPGGAGHEDREPHDQVQDPAPLKGAADQRVVDELAEPVQRGELGEGSQIRRELAERDEQAAGEGAQRQRERDDLRDVLRRQQITGEQAEGGEQQ